MKQHNKITDVYPIKSIEKSFFCCPGSVYCYAASKFVARVFWLLAHISCCSQLFFVLLCFCCREKSSWCCQVFPQVWHGGVSASFSLFVGVYWVRQNALAISQSNEICSPDIWQALWADKMSSLAINLPTDSIWALGILRLPSGDFHLSRRARGISPLQSDFLALIFNSARRQLDKLTLCTCHLFICLNKSSSNLNSSRNLNLNLNSGLNAQSKSAPRAHQQL